MKITINNIHWTDTLLTCKVSDGNRLFLCLFAFFLSVMLYLSLHIIFLGLNFNLFHKQLQIGIHTESNKQRLCFFSPVGTRFQSFVGFGKISKTERSDSLCIKKGHSWCYLATEDMEQDRVSQVVGWNILGTRLSSKFTNICWKFYRR